MPAISKPQIPPQLLPTGDLAQALQADESLSAFSTTGQDISGQYFQAASITEAKISKSTFAGSNLEKLDLSDAVIDNCDFTATDCAESSWRRVQLTGIRGSGLKIHNSTLKDIIFQDCKLNLANFRFAKLKNIIFKDCVLDEADFYQAELHTVRFRNCTFTKAEFSAAQCHKTDFRGSDLIGIIGITGLAGATIDSVQLTSIAPMLAYSFKIHVSDD